MGLTDDGHTSMSGSPDNRAIMTVIMTYYFHQYLLLLSITPNTIITTIPTNKIGSVWD